MTKYCEMIEDPKRIRYALEKSLYLATHGRPGPCWIDIPVNYQGCIIDTDELIAFDPTTETDDVAPAVSEAVIDEIIAKLKSAERPVIYAGNGVRLSGGFDLFEKAVAKLNIPVVTGWDNIDMMADADPLYVGRGGIMGDRPGNFAVQNADVVLSIGNRLSIRQVGYNWKTWAREAFVIMVDVDAEELKKPTLHVEMPVHADAKDFLGALLAKLGDGVLFAENGWQDTCRAWKKDYPVVLPKHFAWEGLANPYAFIKKLSARLPEGYTTVVGNGTACVVGSHGYEIKKGQRFIINSAVASMGYDLPAAVGVCVALDKQEIVCVSGDGSIQMNLQELQTILTNKLPIKIFVINNDGYHSIRQTQTNLFGNHTKVGIGPESADLSFPSLEKLAWAYGYPYAACRTNSEIDATLDAAFGTEGAFIAEIFVDPAQFFEPKSATKRLPDGTLISPPLEDLAPFLDREELKKIMKIPMLDE
jgi:acetolactate synthase-1/2/3 large subunit